MALLVALTMLTTVQGEEVTAVVPVSQDAQPAAKAEPESLGSAIYSPFSTVALVKHERPAASNASSDRDSGLTMTLVASIASVGALVWLLQRC